MNLHSLVRGVVQTVNRDITIGLRKCTGYTTGTNGKQIPTYDAPVPAQGQVQAMDAGTQRHLNSLNIAGVMRKVYLYGNWGGVIRVDRNGGDMLSFPQTPGGANYDWKAVHVMETWPDWCCIGVVLQ